jgi:hypothetical protein
MNLSRLSSAFSGGAGVIAVAAAGWVTPAWWHVAAFVVVALVLDIVHGARTL